MTGASLIEARTAAFIASDHAEVERIETLGDFLPMPPKVGRVRVIRTDPDNPEDVGFLPDPDWVPSVIAYVIEERGEWGCAMVHYYLEDYGGEVRAERRSVKWHHFGFGLSEGAGECSLVDRDYLRALDRADILADDMAERRLAWLEAQDFRPDDDGLPL